MFGVEGATLADRLDSGASLGLSSQDLQDAHQILQLVANLTNCFDLKVIGYDTYDAAVAEMKNLQKTNTLLGGK